MGRKNLLLIAAVALVAAVLLAVSLLMPRTTSRSGGSEVLITVDGAEYARVPLSQPQTVIVTQDGGESNEIVVTETGAYMKSSTCHNQLCVQMGEVTPDNWETRPNQAYVICLPNRVSVELIP